MWNEWEASATVSRHTFKNFIRSYRLGSPVVCSALRASGLTTFWWLWSLPKTSSTSGSRYRNWQDIGIECLDSIRVVLLTSTWIFPGHDTRNPRLRGTILESPVVSLLAHTPLRLLVLRDRLPRSSAVHQYIGYRRWMLFTRSAVQIMRIQPSCIIGTRNQPNSNELLSTTAQRAVAPAGGCTVLVKFMTAVAVAQAKEPPIHRMDWKWGLNANSLPIPIPIIEPQSWPRITFRGCASGDSIEQNCSTAAAPCGEAHSRSILTQRENRKEQKEKYSWQWQN